MGLLAVWTLPACASSAHPSLSLSSNALPPSLLSIHQVHFRFRAPAFAVPSVCSIVPSEIIWSGPISHSGIQTPPAQTSLTSSSNTVLPSASWPAFTLCAFFKKWDIASCFTLLLVSAEREVNQLCIYICAFPLGLPPTRTPLPAPGHHRAPSGAPWASPAAPHWPAVLHRVAYIDQPYSRTSRGHL